MKKFRLFAIKCGSALCMVAMFIAVHSVNITCVGKYYQPKIPKELDRFRKN